MFFHMQGVRKIRILRVFLFFSYKAGVDATEWLESAEEEANKRTVLGRRTYSKPSGRRTGQKHGPNGGKGKNGGDNNGSPDRKKGKGSNPRCPESQGTGSKCLPPRSQPTDPGYVYIIKMEGSDAGIYPPPLVKVGTTR